MTPQHTTKQKPNPKYKILLNLFVFCGTIIILSFFGYKILNEGIYSKKLSFGFVEIEGLYLKLENKFIVDIEKLDLSQSHLFKNDNKTGDIKDIESSVDSVVDSIQNILLILSYFKSLNIHKIIFPNDIERTLLYDGSNYRIYDPYFDAIINTAQNEKEITLEIESLIIYPLSLKLEGYLQYHINKKNLNIHSLRISHIKTISKITNTPVYIQIMGSTDFKKVSLSLKGSKWDQIHFLKPYIEPLHNKILESWLFEKIHFESAQLQEITMEASLNKNFFSHLMRTLEGALILQKPSIYIAPNTTPIQAPNATLKLKNKIIHINFTSPTFSTSSLDTSALQIHLPINKPLEIFIQLRSKKIALEKPLLELLKSLLDISLPVQTKSSFLEAKLDIHLKSNPQQGIIEPNVKGTINGNNTKALLFGQTIMAKDIQTSLDIASDKKRLISITSSNAQYQDALSTQINLNIDALKYTINGDFQIHYADLLPSKIFQTNTLKENPALQINSALDPMTKNIIQAIIQENSSTLPSILQIPNTESSTMPHALRKISLQGSFKDNNIDLNIPELLLHIKQDSQLHIHLKDIEPLYPYMPVLQYFGIKKGTITLHKDIQNTQQAINIEATLENLHYPIYDKNNKLLSKLQLQGSIDNNTISLNTKNQNIKFQKHLNTIKLIFHDYNLDIDELLESKIPVLAEKFQSSENASDSDETLSNEEISQKNAFIRQKQKYEREHDIPPHILYLESNDMDIIYGDYIIPTDSATITLRDGRVNANAAYGNGIADINIAYGQAKISLDNFSAEFINQVFGRRVFQGGLFDLSGILTNKVLQGEISIQNTTFKEFALVQNIVGLIDTIPSLLMFKKPGLSNEGYEIKKGTFLFSMNDEYLGFEKIDITGSAIDIEGNGLVNLKDKTLDLLLRASTLKALSSIISNIPLVGYVTLGKDGKITTNIIVSGSIENPKTEISLLEDVVNAPFKMLHRIFSPFDKLVDTLKGE